MELISKTIQKYNNKKILNRIDELKRERILIRKKAGLISLEINRLKGCLKHK